MARPVRSAPTINIVSMSIVFALFFFGQILVILQPRYNVNSAEKFVLSFDGEVKDQSSPVDTKKDENKIEIPTPNGPPDGTFNTYPVYHQSYKEGFHSNAHCIGDTFRQDAWKYRSCHFQNLCFDTEDRKFVLFTSKEQRDLEKALEHKDLKHFSPASSMNTTVSLGAMNPKWGKEHNLLNWYPELRPVEEVEKTGYYTLQTDKVLIPYHSMAGFNPGHLVWDDFLPLYTLLTAFDLIQKEAVLIRYDLTLAMWASCQRQFNKCGPIIKKFYPLIGAELSKTSTQNHTNLVIQSDQKSKYVCSPNGAAGLGMLSDHGLKLHGWKPSDYDYAYNVGRGGSLYQFRNWMMDNMGVPRQGRKIHSGPYRIVISQGSSKSPNRRASFEEHIKLLREKVGKKYDLEIVTVTLANMKLKEQLELVAGTSIFITMCGGGAVTSMFLPKGASLFAYFHEEDGIGLTPARLDWDLLNNLGYLRVHWLPRPRSGARTKRGRTMPGPKEYDYDAFVKLVEHELDVISHTNDY
mmetsp:Transcript_2283/g.3493  ORF Transcript_2283/g.3493 Transcript_2283/m.3493 type:complete len:521 (-) Transcript_2283:1212-2774(-)